MQVEYKNKPSERNIDPKQVVNEIRNGRSLEAVQKLFGLRFKSDVQDLYMRGLSELGEIPQMSFSKPSPASKQSSSARPAPAVPHETAPKRSITRHAPATQEKPSLIIKANNFRTIGESGTVTLNKALLIEQLGFKVEDTFEIYREDDRIVLQKTTSPPLIDRSSGNGTRTKGTV